MIYYLHYICIALVHYDIAIALMHYDVAIARRFLIFSHSQYMPNAQNLQSIPLILSLWNKNAFFSSFRSNLGRIEKINLNFYFQVSF